MTKILSSLSIYRLTYLFGPTALPIIPATGLQSDSPLSSHSHTVWTTIVISSASHHIPYKSHTPHVELALLQFDIKPMLLEALQDSPNMFHMLNVIV